MVMAGLRGVQFVLTHPVRTLGVYLAMGALGLILAALYYFLSPGLASSGIGLIVLALIVGQLYLILRWMLRIGLLGAESIVYRQASGYMQSDSSRL